MSVRALQGERTIVTLDVRVADQPAKKGPPARWTPPELVSWACRRMPRPQQGKSQQSAQQRAGEPRCCIFVALHPVSDAKGKGGGTLSLGQGDCGMVAQMHKIMLGHHNGSMGRCVFKSQQSMHSPAASPAWELQVIDILKPKLYVADAAKRKGCARFGRRAQGL